MRKPMHQKAAPHIFVNAKKLRAQKTPAEIVLWEALKDRQLGGFRFRQQHPIDEYILDFYCPSARLGVELDGDYHFSDDQCKLDAVRTTRLNILGVKVLRLPNFIVLHDLKAALSPIIQALIEETYS
jgi:very-short-patch-repair endonuclease